MASTCTDIGTVRYGQVNAATFAWPGHVVAKRLFKIGFVYA